MNALQITFSDGIVTVQTYPDLQSAREGHKALLRKDDDGNMLLPSNITSVEVGISCVLAPESKPAMCNSCGKCQTRYVNPRLARMLKR